MARVKLLMNGVVKNVLNATLTKQGERAIDQLKMMLPQNVSVEMNDKILWIQDFMDLGNLSAIYNFQASVKDESGNLNHGVATSVTYGTDDWDGYSAIFNGTSSKITIPALIPNKISEKVKELSLLACKVISVEGMARVDFFYEEESGNLWINEINTLPGFTYQSMYPMLWDASGINISQLVARLVESAKE